MAPSKKSALELLSRLFPETPRERLMAQIVMGQWHFGGHRETQPKALFKPDVLIEEALMDRYVSRGGLKLEHALKVLSLDEKVAGKVLLDAGASTGGFTDCLLHKGASLVYACDVGSNQLDWSLRKEERVRVYEKTNVMDIPSLNLDPTPDWAVGDIAFRSSVSVAKTLLPILKEHWMLLLVKPQFEWLDAPEDYKGVVPQDKYRGILQGVGERLIQRGVTVHAIAPSSLRGKKQGNQEFFYWLTLEKEVLPYTELLEQALLLAFS